MVAVSHGSSSSRRRKAYPVRAEGERGARSGDWLVRGFANARQTQRTLLDGCWRMAESRRHRIVAGMHAAVSCMLSMGMLCG